MNLELEHQCEYCQGKGIVSAPFQVVSCLACDAEGTVLTPDGQKVADVFARLMRREQRRHSQGGTL